MYNQGIRNPNLKGEATKKQIEYAEAISELLGVKLPEEITKKSMSDFISAHVYSYKEAVRQMQLEYELQMEMIDARRDW